jgi:sporulation protein YlmC with PRC-barrel domain
MKPVYKLAALAAAMASLLSAANAQIPAQAERADEFSQSLRYHDYLKGADLRVSELVGARVRNAAGKNVGEIEELVVPSRDQDDLRVIVSVGGVLDVGDKLVALPYNELRVSPDGDTLYVDRTEEQLEAAPAFTYEFEAVAPRSQRQQAAAPPAAARAETDRPRAATPIAAAGADADRSRSTAAPRADSDTPRAAAPRAAAAKADNVVLDVFDHRASDLIGATVLDDRGESVAKVDDLVVSLDDDKLHAVLAVGGFAGLGAKRISIPLDDLHITSDDGEPQVRIAMTGEQLQELLASRPEFRYERQVAQAPGTAPRG